MSSPPPTPTRWTRPSSPWSAPPPNTRGSTWCARSSSSPRSASARCRPGTPSTPSSYPPCARHPRVEDVLRDPVGPNAELGTYTNFVNLLDLCAVAAPAGNRANGLPFGVSLVAPAQSDHVVLALAAQLLHEDEPRGAAPLTAGGRGRAPVGPAAEPPAARPGRPTGGGDDDRARLPALRPRHHARPSRDGAGGVGWCRDRGGGVGARRAPGSGHSCPGCPRRSSSGRWRSPTAPSCSASCASRTR